MDAFAFFMISARIDDYERMARKTAMNNARRSMLKKEKTGKPLTPRGEKLMLVAVVQRNA
jgi:hypothetical protein